jgi:hypothetical protein
MHDALFVITAGVLVLLGTLSLVRVVVKDLDALCEDISNARSLCRAWNSFSGFVQAAVRWLTGAG